MGWLNLMNLILFTSSFRFISLDMWLCLAIGFLDHLHQILGRPLFQSPDCRYCCLWLDALVKINIRTTSMSFELRGMIEQVSLTRPGEIRKSQTLIIIWEISGMSLSILVCVCSFVIISCTNTHTEACFLFIT